MKSSKLRRLALLAACNMQMYNHKYYDMNKHGVFGVPEFRTRSVGNTLADGKPIKQQPKQLHEFKIKGRIIMAYSRKDAIKRLKTRGKI